MNVIIPMAGNSSRFFDAGYEIIKPLIPLKNGEPMIEAVVGSLQLPDANYIFIVQDKHDDEYDLKTILDSIVPGCMVVRTNGLTGGAAETILLAEQYCNKSSPVIVANSDQLVSFNMQSFLNYMNEGLWDGGILTFKSTDTKWSYVEVDHKSDDYGPRVTRVAEKQVISNRATCGIYYYHITSDMFKFIREMMLCESNKVNGEWYFCPVYMTAIKNDHAITIYDVEKMIGLGTPEDLDLYMSN